MCFLCETEQPAGTFGGNRRQNWWNRPVASHSTWRAQAHVMQAAADISSIIASERKKKAKTNANKMAALALIFNPNMAVAASHSAANGHWARTDQLVAKAIPGQHFKPSFHGP